MDLSEIHHTSKLTVAAIALGSTFVFITLTLLYRLTLHPLAKYPGRLHNRLSGWAYLLDETSGDGHLELWKQHEAHGPIVRIGPNRVSINTISALKEIYVSRKANVKKADWYLAIVAANSGASSTHSEIDREKHAFRRRVLDHAFSDSALRSAEPYVIQNIQTWCDYLSQGVKAGEWTPAKNMADLCTYLGYDIMGDLTFGKSFKTIESETNRYVPDLMLQGTGFVNIVGSLPIASLVRPLLGTALMDKLGGEMARQNTAYVQYSNQQMAERIDNEGDATKETRKDFMHYLIHARDPQTGRGFTNTELNADSSLLISAGSDTTAITLAATLFYFLHFPATLQKATAEVRKAFKSVEEIRTSKSLSDLTYMRACIDEALRMAPPVPAHLPREVLPGGLTIDGAHLPAGTIVGTPIWSIHHNKEYYPEPFNYRPERWIIDEKSGVTADSVATARSAFTPFSLGSRGCIGKSVAYMELTLTLATLLLCFDMRLPEDAKRREPSGEGIPNHEHPERRRRDEYQLKEMFLVARDGPMVEFRAVGSS